MLKDKKYISDILIILVFGLIIFTIICSKQLNNFDEVWVFNTARNIANGLLPYKDFNLITTPGLPILCGVILKLFGTEMFYMRIMATILNTLILYMIYKILRVLNINKYVSIVITGTILGLYTDYLCIDYNVTILFIALLVLYIELKNYIKEDNLLKLNLKQDIVLGLISGTSILMKQTTGICFTLAFIGYKILAVRNKEQIKDFLKIGIIRFISTMIPVLLLITYLSINNIIYDFIDYAVLGIKEFTNNIPYWNLLKGDLSFWAITAPITLIAILYMGIKNKDKIAIILFSYSISTFVVVYPISDNSHFLIASTITLITLIYIIKNLYDNRIKKLLQDKIIYFFTDFSRNIVFVMTIIFISICSIKLFSLNLNKYNELNNFKYIPVSNEFCEEIKNVGNYIKTSENKVYIVEARAALYMIPINRYNKNYDMFLIGNMGNDSSNKIISDLKENYDIELLLLKDNYYMNWQTPLDIIGFIKENYTKKGSIGAFDIYKLQK